MADYNSDEVIVLLQEIATGRSRTAEGFADGSRVEVSENEEDVTLNVGSDGEFCFSLDSDESGQIVITLAQWSDTNDFLAEMRQKQNLYGGGKLSVMVKDLNGRSLHESTQARIQGMPDAEYAPEAGEREWTLLCGKMKNFVGGNS